MQTFATSQNQFEGSLVRMRRNSRQNEQDASAYTRSAFKPETTAKARCNDAMDNVQPKPCCALNATRREEGTKGLTLYFRCHSPTVISKQQLDVVVSDRARGSTTMAATLAQMMPSMIHAPDCCHGRHLEDYEAVSANVAGLQVFRQHMLSLLPLLGSIEDCKLSLGSREDGDPSTCA